MANIVRDLPTLFAGSSGGTGQVTNGIGNLDDASSITLFFISTANGIPTTIQVSQFDPAIPLQTGVSQSTNWFALSTAIFAGVTANTNFSSSGNSFTISSVSFRGLRIGLTASSSFGNSNGDPIARVSKQISV